MATDIIITSILLWQFKDMKSTAAAGSQWVISRLMSLTLRTSLLTTCMVLSNRILVLAGQGLAAQIPGNVSSLPNQDKDEV